MCFQMEVGLAAAKAITAVHGKNYKVGTSPDILCEYFKPMYTRMTWRQSGLENRPNMDHTNSQII